MQRCRKEDNETETMHREYESLMFEDQNMYETIIQ